MIPQPTRAPHLIIDMRGAYPSMDYLHARYHEAVTKAPVRDYRAIVISHWQERQLKLDEELGDRLKYLEHVELLDRPWLQVLSETFHGIPIEVWED